MSWLITPSFKAGVVVSDSDANTYLRAVETADGQPLEPAVAWAVDSFVVGCKRDDIWNAIKASCILAGARTRLGALTPLKGAAPTSVNFVDGDYNRETGLMGDGSTKYLNSNRANNADPQNSRHQAVFRTNNATFTEQTLIGLFSGADETYIDHRSTINVWRFRSSASGSLNSSNARTTSGFIGCSRSGSSVVAARIASATTQGSDGSSTPSSLNHFVFARNNSGTAVDNYFVGRLAFYSIGESLDLALLDARVTTLINAIAAAIP